MRGFAKLALLVTLGAVALAGRRSDADLMLLTVRAPRDLPEGLTVKSETRDNGTIAFEVSVDAEQVAHADALYKGRVRPRAFLKVGTAEGEAASVSVQGTTEGKRTLYYFRLSPSAARTSELQVGVSLYEKDGHPTLGGGRSVQIHLAGFDPARKAASPKVKQ